MKPLNFESTEMIPHKWVSDGDGDRFCRWCGEMENETEGLHCPERPRASLQKEMGWQDREHSILNEIPD